MTNVVFVLLFIQFRSINALSTTPSILWTSQQQRNVRKHIHTYERENERIEVCERITTRSSSPLLWWEKKKREDENQRSLIVGM